MHWRAAAAVALSLFRLAVSRKKCTFAAPLVSLMIRDLLKTIIPCLRKSGIFHTFAAVFNKIIMTTISELYDSIEMGFDPGRVEERRKERRRRTREAEKLRKKQERKAKCKERLWQFVIAALATIVGGVVLMLLTKELQ